MKRAYALLEIRSADDEKRTIDGIASTGAVDSYNTILEPEGAEFKLPMPVLYQHNSSQPIGHVVQATAGAKGIRVKIQIAKAGVAGFIDEAWSLIKNGLVQGLSVGFEPIEQVFDKSFQGFRYPKWKWHELSTVTIPANEEATMLTVRAADEAVLAASGTRERSSVVRLNLPASGPSQDKQMKTVREHIAAIEAKRTANDTRMDEIMQKCADESRSRDTAESEEYDTLQAEQRSLDSDIKAFQEREKSMVARAAAVTPPAAHVEPAKVGQEQRTGHIEVGNRNEPKGIGMARMAMAMVRAHKEHRDPVLIAQATWKDSPEVAQYIRTAVEAGDTTTSGWASQLLPAAQQMAGDFIEMLRAKTLIGRIPGLKEVPFNVAVPLQSGAGTYGWVGEAAPKPVTKPTYGSATLRFEKAAGIIVITQELARFSSPSAELLVRNEMLAGLTRFFDAYFINSNAAVSNVAPAGILNGISSTAVTGTTAAKFRVDMNTIIQKMITNNQNPADLVILMSSGMAMSLSSMITTLGTQEFPSINARGGEYLGIPIVDSQALGSTIILINPGDILHAADPAIRIDVSTEASVEMDTAPVAGESSPITSVETLKSLWQNNLVGIRAEQFNTWKVARTAAVEYLVSAAYVPS